MPTPDMLPSSQVKSSGRGSQSSATSTDRASGRGVDVITATSYVPIIASGVTRINELPTVKRVVWNELLAYISYYRNNSTAAALNDVVVSHFSAEDVADAKRLLVREFQAVNGVGQFLTELRKSAVRTVRDAELDDIVGILQTADADPDQTLTGYLFIVSDFKQLPKYGPGELNISAVVDRQVRTEASIRDLSTAVQ